MALTPAERKRRSRRHRNGDHAECDPARCGALAREATLAGQPRDPLPRAEADDLAAVVAELAAVAVAPVPAVRALLLVARRLSLRLDRLHDYLEGRESAWMRLHARTDDGSTVEVVVDAALSEERQIVAEFRQVVTALVKLAPTKSAQSGVSRRDELAARRKDRLARASGS